MLSLGRIDDGVAGCQQGRPLLIAEGAQQPHLQAQGTDEHTVVSRSSACPLSNRDGILQDELAHGCPASRSAGWRPQIALPGGLHPLCSFQPYLIPQPQLLHQLLELLEIFPIFC